ncbi:hypothetical protein [Arthrobacter sp. LFS091]|uniref:hypothetical protein n=1 Tax=Arthrobacter sp. LFS091 TaxID=3229892 RepID=UPI003A7FEA7E
MIPYHGPEERIEGVLNVAMLIPTDAPFAWLARSVLGASTMIKGAKYADEVAEGLEDAKNYVDVTAKKSRVRNRATNASADEVAETLKANEWLAKKGNSDSYEIFLKENAKYVLRKEAKTWEGPTPDYYPPGQHKPSLKIRLGADE